MRRKTKSCTLLYIDMDIYAAKEKDETLIKIISKDYISIDNEREMGIVDSALYPMELIEKPIKMCMPDHYLCIASQKGKDFIKAGGFQALEKERKDEEAKKNKIDKLTTENLELQNNELEYKKKIRHQESIIRVHQYIEAILGIALIITTLILMFFKS